MILDEMISEFLSFLAWRFWGVCSVKYDQSEINLDLGGDDLCLMELQNVEHRLEPNQQGVGPRELTTSRDFRVRIPLQLGARKDSFLQLWKRGWFPIVPQPEVLDRFRAVSTWGALGSTPVTLQLLWDRIMGFWGWFTQIWVLKVSFSRDFLSLTILLL